MKPERDEVNIFQNISINTIQIVNSKYLLKLPSVHTVIGHHQLLRILSSTHLLSSSMHSVRCFVFAILLISFHSQNTTANHQDISITSITLHMSFHTIKSKQQII